MMYKLLTTVVNHPLKYVYTVGK